MTVGPKRKDRRNHSDGEGADEPPRLIDKEEADIETENPIEETEPLEQVVRHVRGRREGKGAAEPSVCRTDAHFIIFCGRVAEDHIAAFDSSETCRGDDPDRDQAMAYRLR
jgi:hypothetical protein